MSERVRGSGRTSRVIEVVSCAAGRSAHIARLCCGILICDDRPEPLRAVAAARDRNAIARPASRSAVSGLVILRMAARLALNVWTRRCSSIVSRQGAPYIGGRAGRSPSGQREGEDFVHTGAAVSSERSTAARLSSRGRRDGTVTEEALACSRPDRLQAAACRRRGAASGARSRIADRYPPGPSAAIDPG